MTWVNIGSVAVTAAATFWAARSAKRSSRAEAASERIAAQQARTAYAEMVRGWQPGLSMELLEVEYRWAGDRWMIEAIGEPSNPGVDVGDSLTIKAAEKRHVRVEIVVTGRLINRTDEQTLVTARGTGNTSWNSFLNENLFLIEGKDTHRFILPPKSETAFKWIDRKSLSTWRSLYHATASPAEGIDPTFTRPAKRARGWRDWWKTPEEKADLLWGAHERTQAGFEVVAETRMASRVATVWRTEPRQSAVRPVHASDTNDEVRWALQENVQGPIDDDVMMYRCHYDIALAQLNDPRIVRLPGRL